jgi:isoleucyl-tRNA synthetase
MTRLGERKDDFMYKKVDSWVDLIELEHTIQKFWDDTQAFDKLRKQNAGKEPWSFLDGPITANNPMGVHHAWGRSLKDLFQRYWAMNGRELRYQNGFDCQGLWVEVEVEKELGFKSAQDIVDFGIDKFVDLCKERVKKFSGIQTEQSIRLGYWMDWDNSYYTMSDENNYTIWSFLKKCHERGKVYRGNDVMPWSGRMATGYSQMEVVEGRKLVAHEAIFLKFPLRGREKENLLVWTTTPWTLTSNVGAMINVDLEYVKLRCLGDGELYIFAAENLEFKRLDTQYKEKKDWLPGVPRLKTLAQIFNEKGGYEIEGYIKGAEMIGWEYDGPFDELDAQHVVGGYPFTDPKVTESGVQAHRVIDGGRDSHGGAVVVVGEGTGIVHTAPGCGDIDHAVGVQLGLPAIAPLTPQATFLEKFGPLSGKHALDHETVQWIIDSLKDKGLLVYTEQYPHVYPHCWRSGDPLVFRLVDEWYINMDWRDEIKDVVKQIRWIPEWGEERELEWLTNMRDWMISKKRYWGLALPIWVCDDCEHFDVIGGREELKERAVSGWDEFDGHSPHRPFVDAVKLTCPKCGGVMSRVPDVGNPWLDAGIVPYSTVHYNSDRDYWKKWMPADLVLECFPGQFRNWFYSLLAMSTMMENTRPFKTLFGHALVRAEDGREMHKSWGNAIWFDEAVEKIGADIMRWIYCRQEPTVNLNFGYGVAREIRGKFFNTLWNTYGFFVNYARLDNFVPSVTPTAVSERPDFDRWILSELQQTVAKCREGIEDYNPRAAGFAIEAFVENLSNWYVRHNRRRYWKGADDRDTLMAYETLYECLYTLVRLIAPIMPFASEEMYQNLVRSHAADAPESVHHADYPTVDSELIDATLSEDMAAIQRINWLALSARESAGVKVRQPLPLLTLGPADEIESRAATRFKAMLMEDLNVKAVEVSPLGTAAPDVPMDLNIKPNLKILGKRVKDKLAAFKVVFAGQTDAIAAAWRKGDTTFTVTVEGEDFILDRSDLLVKEQKAQNAAIATDNASWAYFDTTISDELRVEGMMRELQRRLQVLRKDIGLEIEDRIRITWESASEDIARIFASFGELLQSELLAVEIGQGAVGDGHDLNIDGADLRIAVVKA